MPLWVMQEKRPPTFMSLWMMPCAWQYSKASTVSATYSLDTSSSSAPRLRSKLHLREHNVMYEHEVLSHSTAPCTMNRAIHSRFCNVSSTTTHALCTKYCYALCTAMPQYCAMAGEYDVLSHGTWRSSTPFPAPHAHARNTHTHTPVAVASVEVLHHNVQVLLGGEAVVEADLCAVQVVQVCVTSWKAFETAMPTPSTPNAPLLSSKCLPATPHIKHVMTMSTRQK
eukprot:385894-Pelagomonas_calceolata.AAC.4